MDKIMISKSPRRHTFQIESHIKNAREKNEPVDEIYVERHKQMIRDISAREETEEFKQNNLEYDLRTNEYMLEKVRKSKVYAQNLYAALCNNDFAQADAWKLLKGETWSCSWRFAGGIIADMRQEGDYIDWYCSGIGMGDKSHVSEGIVTDAVREDLRSLGWLVVTEEFPEEL